MRCGPTCAGPACPAIPQVECAEDGHCLPARLTFLQVVSGERRRRACFRRHACSIILLVTLVFDRREGAERFGRERDRLTVAYDDAATNALPASGGQPKG